ncbi:hypothetical protein AGLY_005799 [Aphis glycines]|uniref:Uncharacterized protein n=1 Tax=Aphis glycines TaxID=307491 RepID=A0A6G0TSE8_APHGL|nr:hypothetical protein AGLY_005799 [Aphis glycines]
MMQGTRSIVTEPHAFSTKMTLTSQNNNKPNTTESRPVRQLAVRTSGGSSSHNTPATCKRSSWTQKLSCILFKAACSDPYDQHVYVLYTATLLQIMTSYFVLKSSQTVYFVFVFRYVLGYFERKNMKICLLFSIIGTQAQIIMKIILFAFSSISTSISNELCPMDLYIFSYLNIIFLLTILNPKNLCKQVKIFYLPSLLSLYVHRSVSKFVNVEDEIHSCIRQQCLIGHHFSSQVVDICDQRFQIIFNDHQVPSPNIRIFLENDTIYKSILSDIVLYEYVQYNKHQIKSQTTLILPTIFGLSFSNADGDTSISFVLQASHLSLTVTTMDFNVVGSIIFTRLPHTGSKLGFGVVRSPILFSCTASEGSFVLLQQKYTWPPSHGDRSTSIVFRYCDELLQPPLPSLAVALRSSDPAESNMHPVARHNR